MREKNTNKKKSYKGRRYRKHPALTAPANPKIRQEFIDLDYLHKLSEKEKDWLNKFMDEYNGANLNFKDLKKNLHKNKRLKKDCTDRVNARNRDTYAKAKITASLNFLGNKEIALEGNNPEDAMIEYIDSKYAKTEEGSDEGLI